MVSKIGNQLKNNIGGIILLTFISWIIELGVGILALVLSVFSQGMSSILLCVVSLIILTINKKYFLRVVSTNGKAQFKDILKDIHLSSIKLFCANLLMTFVVTIPTIIGIVATIVIVTVSGIVNSIKASGVNTIHPIIIIVLIGLILINCIILNIFFAFIPYAIIDEKLDDLSYIKRMLLALKMAKAYRFKLLGCLFSSILVIFGGTVAFIVGLSVVPSIIELMFLNVYTEARDKHLYMNDI